MLSFQVIEYSHSPAKGIKIYCDAEGMSVLLGALAHLVGERAAHLHLRAPSAGGNDLEENTPSGSAAVSEVIIDYAEGD